MVLEACIVGRMIFYRNSMGINQIIKNYVDMQWQEENKTEEVEL